MVNRVVDASAFGALLFGESAKPWVQDQTRGEVLIAPRHPAFRARQCLLGEDAAQSERSRCATDRVDGLGQRSPGHGRRYRPDRRAATGPRPSSDILRCQLSMACTGTCRRSNQPRWSTRARRTQTGIARAGAKRRSCRSHHTAFAQLIDFAGGESQLAQHFCIVFAKLRRRRADRQRRIVDMQRRTEHRHRSMSGMFDRHD